MLPLTCESMPGLVFQVAQVCESEEIFEFLMSHFFPEVPTFKLVDMDKNGYICKIVSRSHSDSGLVLWPHNLSAACGRR